MSEEPQDKKAVEAAGEDAGSKGQAEKAPAAPAKEAPKKEAKAPAKAAVEPKQKPELDDETKQALAVRDEKNGQRPRFRRQEWFRYKKLGGKHAPWRRPTGIHSKQRRHYKYRPPLVSVGYRGPAAVRGLHPSGFEEVPVHRPADLDAIDPKTQAARVGGTVGGRKAELIEKRADELGIRVLNRRS